MLALCVLQVMGEFRRKERLKSLSRAIVLSMMPKGSRAWAALKMQQIWEK